MNDPIRTDSALNARDSAFEMVILTECREQTVALGATIGACLPQATIVCLDGDLGAGKTALTAGLADGDEFLELGFDEYLNSDGICVIEWSSRVRTALPDGCLMIDLALSDPERPDERKITLRWPGHEDLLRAIPLQGRENRPC